MKTLLLGAALLGLLTVPAVADTDARYDRNLEQAAIQIAAGKVGSIRGGFTFDVKPLSVIVSDQLSTGSLPQRDTSGWHDGLAPAIEGKGTRITF